MLLEFVVFLGTDGVGVLGVDGDEIGQLFGQNASPLLGGEFLAGYDHSEHLTQVLSSSLQETKHQILHNTNRIPYMYKWTQHNQTPFSKAAEIETEINALRTSLKQVVASKNEETYSRKPD